MSRPWREVETNTRPAPLAANRVAVYGLPTEVGLRYLHVAHIQRARTADEADVMELTNVAHLIVSPSVAKRLIVDLQNAVTSIEERIGRVPTEEELAQLWKADSTGVTGGATQ